MPGGGGGGGGGEKDSHIKRGGMLVVSHRGVNFGFWSHLGCSGQNASYVAVKISLGLRAKKYKSVYLHFYISSRR